MYVQSKLLPITLEASIWDIGMLILDDLEVTPDAVDGLLKTSWQDRGQELKSALKRLFSGEISIRRV